jgi:hypothetical protein
VKPVPASRVKPVPASRVKPVPPSLRPFGIVDWLPPLPLPTAPPLEAAPPLATEPPLEAVPPPVLELLVPPDDGELPPLVEEQPRMPRDANSAPAAQIDNRCLVFI